ncbi:MAG TPA: hypothetical protein VIL46_13125 [Gemmataceae bacterium]
MKGFIVRTLMLAGVGGALTAGTGCMGGNRYRDWVDPCWPQRYNATARAEVVSYFAPQVQNGHILDQTIWNYHFVPGTAELHPSGLEKLNYLVRRRPQPDPRLFLATARDIPYDPDAPQEFTEAQRDLDQRRVQAIQTYLAAQTASRPMAFEVLIHDPMPVGIAASEAAQAMTQSVGGVRGTLGAYGGGGLGSGGLGGGGLGSGGGGGTGSSGRGY